MTEDKPTPRKRPAMTVQGGLNKALKSAEWLSDSDAATIELAKALAKAIDDEGASAQVASRLLDALKALGLTAVSRAELGIDKKREEVNPLDSIRSAGVTDSARVVNAPHLHAVPNGSKPRK